MLVVLWIVCFCADTDTVLLIWITYSELISRQNYRYTGSLCALTHTHKTTPNDCWINICMYFLSTLKVNSKSLIRALHEFSTFDFSCFYFHPLPFLTVAWIFHFQILPLSLAKVMQQQPATLNPYVKWSILFSRSCSVTYMYIKNHSSTCTDNNDDGFGDNTLVHWRTHIECDIR